MRCVGDWDNGHCGYGCELVHSEVLRTVSGSVKESEASGRWEL